MGVDHVAGADDQRPEPGRVKRPANVGGPASLAAEAGHQDPGVGHGGAEVVELLGPGSAHDCTYGAVGAAGCGAGGQGLDAGGHVLVDRLAVAGKVLEILAAGV